MTQNLFYQNDILRSGLERMKLLFEAYSKWSIYEATSKEERFEEEKIPRHNTGAKECYILQDLYPIYFIQNKHIISR